MPDIVAPAAGSVNGGGLATFDAGAAAQNLANVGLPPAPAAPIPIDTRPIEGPPVPPGTPVPVARPDDGQTPAAPVTDPLAVGRKAIGDMQAAQADEAKAAAAQAKAEQEKADADAAENEKAAAEMRKRQEDQDRQQQATEQARARLVAIADKADSDVANYKFRDYADTIPVGSKIGLIVGAALSGLAGNVDPLAQINKLTAQHFEKQKAELSSKENFAAAKRRGVTDFDQHVNDRRMELEFNERNYREALAKEIEAQGLRSGRPVQFAKAQQMAAKVRADGDAKLASAVDEYARAEAARAHATLLEKKARGGAGHGGGGGNSDALTQFVEAAGALKPGEAIPPSLVKLGGKAGFKLKDIGAQIEKYRGSGAKSATEAAKAETAAGFDPKAAYREDGKVVGYVPSGRGGAAAFGANMQKYSTAIRALDVLAKRAEESPTGTLPWGPELHAGVLAIAATTKANGTDRTVAHEEGTLKGPLGLVSAKAIRSKIAELKTEVSELKGTLIPPRGGESSGGAAPAPQGKRVRLKDGRVGLLEPDGTFHQDS